MNLREWFLQNRVRRAGNAVIKADRKAHEAEERLRQAVRAFAEFKNAGAPLKRLWPASKDADYREVQLRG